MSVDYGQYDDQKWYRELGQPKKPKSEEAVTEPGDTEDLKSKIGKELRETV